MQDCAHPSCTCKHETSEMVEQGGKRYCNERCAAQEHSPGTGCSCGHDQCAG